MRIVHVVRQFHPAIGGLENVVLSLAREQRRGGVDACVITLNRPLRGDRISRWPDRDLVDGVPVARLPWTGSPRYPLAPQVLSHLKGFDLIHVHGVDFFADYLALTSMVRRTPMVLSTHGGFFHTGFARHLKRIYFETATRAAMSRYARIFACSENDAALFSGIAGSKVRLIENGVDIAKFAGAASSIVRPAFVAIGRIAAHKRNDLLISAFETVALRHQDARLHILGNDFDGTLPLLRDRAEKSPAHSQIHISDGLTDQQIRERLGECSFIVSASGYEGFGLSIVEGMSAGLVPLVSPLPSFKAIVRDAGAGHLVDFNNSDTCGADILRILGQEAAASGHRARVIAASERYSWQHVAKRFQAEYEDVLGLHRRDILGVKIAALEKQDAVTAIDRSIDSGEQLTVAFANANTLNFAARDSRVRSALNEGLVLNDGIGADIASRLKFGRSFPANMNGTDFVPAFLDDTRHRLKIYLVGARPGVINDAARAFRARWPRHTIVGARDGYFKNEASVLETCRRIRETEADIVLAGLGNPKQELWIAEHANATNAKVLMGVGALFDFLSGHVSRAPDWVRRAKCEWIYRLVHEPRRLASRYLIGNTTFLFRVWRDRRQG